MCVAAVVIVGCTTNDDCRQTEACFNRDCVDPCNCGTNAQCFVANHKPVCFCPEGYTGNPEVECVKGRTIGLGMEMMILFVYNESCKNGKLHNS